MLAIFHWCSLLCKFVSLKFVTWKKGLLRYKNLLPRNRSFRSKITVKFSEWYIARFMKQAFSHICIHACVNFLTISNLLDPMYNIYYIQLTNLLRYTRLIQAFAKSKIQRSFQTNLNSERSPPKRLLSRSDNLIREKRPQLTGYLQKF